MSQKAIKKKSGAKHRKGIVQIPIQPLTNDNSRTAPKPLPSKSFPMNKFIALPEGLRPRSSQSSEESSSPRRSTPIKAIPQGTSLSDSRAHLYVYSNEPGGNERLSCVTSEVVQVDDNTDPVLHNYSQSNLQFTSVNTSLCIGSERHSRRDQIPNATSTPRPNGTATSRPNATSTPRPNGTATSRPDATSTPRPNGTATSRPDATSTPRSQRRRASGGYYSYTSSHNSTRSSTPNGSINSVDSAVSGYGKRRYKKRSQSAPPVNSQRNPLQDTDYILQNWERVDTIPGLTREVTYETIQDGVSIQRENWTSANIGVSPGRIGHTIYRSNSVNSAASINTNTSYNSYYTGSTDSTTSELEFTDVCNFNPGNHGDTHNVSVKSVNSPPHFARSGDTYFTGEENLGVNIINSKYHSDNHSIHSVNGIKSSQSDIVPHTYKVVRSYSDIHPASSGMDENRNMAQFSLPRTYMANGAPQTGIVIYKHGTGERILVNDSHSQSPYAKQGFLSVGRKQGTLMQSKSKFSSMPSLAESKGDKKLMKLLKKQEKEERKRREKEEKKRAKEEKKRQKLEKKLKIKTLPRNFHYQENNGIGSSSSIRDKVFRRPMLTLSAVPIDFEDGPSGKGYVRGSTPAPKMAPPPPPMPEPSQRTMAQYASAPDLLRLEQVYGATLRGVPKEYSKPFIYNDYGPRTVVLQRASKGYGFVLRGAKSQLEPKGELDFRPSPEFPALQYLDSVDPGSVSDKAGLKGGDFILEINGENVVRASHDRVVHLIRGTGDTLAMKVVTVKPGNRNTDWFQNQDKSLTMPNRKKKAAPAPPQRDPRTSLSISKSEGQSISEELAVMETLDKAIYERKNSQENKTASIRSRTAAKRVSCVELDNIGVTSSLERSKSTPDLLDGNSRQLKNIYATPMVPDRGNLYAVPGANNDAPGSPTKLGTRPKGPPPAPPSETGSPKKQAPKPPQTEVVPIDFRTQESQYASSKVYTQRKESSDTLKQSSFRPVNDDSGSEKSFGSSSGPKYTSSNGEVVIHHKPEEVQTDKHGVSFAEDKVLDSAASFLKKHPNAKLLITSNGQPKLRNTNSVLYEPEPDYDVRDDKNNQQTSSPARRQDNRQSVTVISVRDNKESATSTQSKRYTIHSSIPTEDKNSYVIPPRPDGPAPSPPTQSRKVAPQPPPIAINRTETPPPLPDTPPPDFDQSPSPREVPVTMNIHEETKAAPAPAPAPPPPPPPPPVPSVAELEKTSTNLKPEIAPIPFTDIAAAVAKRQERIDKEGLKVGPAGLKQAPKPQSALETNQAAILAAVEKRRKQLEQKSDSEVVDEIESRIQKTKKLQAAKFNITGSKPVKKPEDSKPNKSETVSQSGKSKVVSEAKTQALNIKPVKAETDSKPKELNFTVKSTTTSKPSGITEIKPKIASAKQVNGALINKKPETAGVKPQPLDNKEGSNMDTKTDKSTTNGQSDFLALAEKKRQDYLSRKNKTPPGSTVSTPRSSTAGTPEKELFRTKKIEITPAEKKEGSPPVSAKPKLIKGATTTQSYTEYQSANGPVKVRPISTMNGDKTSKNFTGVPPPPMEFRDGKRVENTVVQVEIIPPPANFSMDNNTSYENNQHSPAFSPDSVSVVSSLSTLSSMSGDQDGRDGYDDLIAPPPPGFDDGDGVVIAPPPEFGNENRKNNENSVKSFSDKPVECWLCNDVLDWLDSLSMGQYKHSFQQNCIDGQKLLSLTRNNYIDLGVTQVGHRMTIERSIKKAAFKQASSNIIASERL